MGRLHSTNTLQGGSYNYSLIGSHPGLTLNIKTTAAMDKEHWINIINEAKRKEESFDKVIVYIETDIFSQFFCLAKEIEIFDKNIRVTRDIDLITYPYDLGIDSFHVEYEHITDCSYYVYKSRKNARTQDLRAKYLETHP